MKKLFIASILCFVLAGAGMAALLDMKGALQTEIEYKPDAPLAGFTFARLDLENKVGANLKGLLGLRLYSNSFFYPYHWQNDFFEAWPYTYIYAEAEGALWKGAEPFKMTMGSLDVKYSPYVAWFGYDTKYFFGEFPSEDQEWFYFGFQGIAFDNIKLGKIDTRGFYAFFTGNDPEGFNVMGANFKGTFDEFELDATFVKTGEPVAYDISASLSPVPNLNLSSQFIGDGVAEEGWYKFAVSYTGVPNWRIGAAYRDFSVPLVLALRDTTPPKVDGSFVVPNPYDLNKGLKGLILNAATNYAGYDLSGEYDYGLRTTAVTAKKDNWSAKLKFFYPREEKGFANEVESLVVFRGSAAADLEMLKNVEFEGVIEFGDEIIYGGRATYKTPGGLKVLAEYYNGDLKDDNGLGWIQDKGLTIRAGYSVDF